MRRILLALAAVLFAGAAAAQSLTIFSGVPYALTPVGGNQYNVTVSGSTALTVPVGARYAIVCALTAAISYTTDGTTTPSATVGNQIQLNTCIALQGIAILNKFHALSATGKLQVEYFQ